MFCICSLTFSNIICLQSIANVFRIEQVLANSLQIYVKEWNPLDCNLPFESMMPFNSAQLLILSCILRLLVSVSKKMSNSLSQNYLNKTLTPGGGILVRELSEQLFNNLYCKGKVWSTSSADLCLFFHGFSMAISCCPFGINVK